MDKSKLRDKAAEILLKHDLDINGATVKQVIDMLMEFGEETAKMGFYAGKLNSTSMATTIEEFINKTFHDIPKNPR